MGAAAAVAVGAEVDLTLPVEAVVAVAWVEIQDAAVAVVVEVLHSLVTLPCHSLGEIDCCLLDSRNSAVAWARRTLAAVAVAADCCCCC